MTKIIIKIQLFFARIFHLELKESTWKDLLKYEE
jgi:hypothetical protein